MGPDSHLMTALLSSLVSLLWLVVLAWIALRVLSRRRDGLGRARSILNRRLAAGEIELEEYYERESALRQAEPVPPPRRRLR